MVIYDGVVIGAGPAGLMAAIYLKRANLNVLLIDSGVPGGQINRTNSVENYLGFSQIDGPTLANKMYQQIVDNKIEYKYGTVTNIIDGPVKKVIVGNEEINTKGVIIATGRIPRELGLDNEKGLVGRGISFCAICDGFFFKDKVVSVVGGGSTALEEALYLAKIASKVYLIHRRDEFRGEETLVTRVLNTSNIEILYNEEVVEILEENDKLTGIKLHNKEITTDGLFIFIGSIPKHDFTKELSLKEENGYLVVDSMMRTSIKGIYACGDIIKKHYYQISTAVGEGAIAALTLKKEIE